MSKTARWLDLIAFLLQHRFPVTREQIFDHVSGYREGDADPESARRKFERDKDELRALGIQIETKTIPDAAGDEPATGYRLLERDFYLPYLQLQEATVRQDRPYRGVRSVRLSRQHLDIVDRATRRLAEHPSLPLRQAAQSARRKLAFDLPIPEQRIERILGESGKEEPNETLEVLQQAVARRTAVGCRYYTIGRDVEAERVIEPYGLFFNWGRWYCVAGVREDPTCRVFRVDRVSDAKLLRGPDAEFQTSPGDFDIRDYLGRSAWELSETAPRPVTVRFRFPESRWVIAQGVGNPIEPVTDDGGAVLGFDVRDTNPFLRWLLTFRDHAQIEDPPDLADELNALRQRVAALYAES
jgi:predicted DNA-binding transcriptional regulator YafY